MKIEEISNILKEHDITIRTTKDNYYKNYGITSELLLGIEKILQ